MNARYSAARNPLVLYKGNYKTELDVYEMESLKIKIKTKTKKNGFYLFQQVNFYFVHFDKLNYINNQRNI